MWLHSRRFLKLSSNLTIETNVTTFTPFRQNDKYVTNSIAIANDGGYNVDKFGREKCEE